MKLTFLVHTTTQLHIFGTVHIKNPDTSQEFKLNANALDNVVDFYLTSATVFVSLISFTEISEMEKLLSSFNMSVGTNMFINGKLDNSLFIPCLCQIKVSKLSLNVTSATLELPLILHKH